MADASQHNGALPARNTGPGQKDRWVSLSRKRTSLLGKFPISEPGRDISEKTEKVGRFYGTLRSQLGGSV
jgi:hypothetical protein